MSRSPLQAALFDMDGTLVDTERLWWDAVAEVAAGLGRALSEADQPDVLGRPVEHTAAWLAARTGADGDALSAGLHREFADRVRTGIVPRPGALELLRALAREGVPTALVTASPRAVADTVLDVLGRDLFAVSVTADDTEHTKPAPDPYLAACRALGVDPAACVAVEDTRTGVTSAEAAGCVVLAVPSLAPIEEAPGRTVRESLEGVTPASLRRLVAPDGPALRVMTWNLWFGGTKVRDHRAKQLKVITETGVDVVGLQETYGTAAQELAEALGWHHHRAGDNLGIISRHPITARLGDPDVGFYGAAGVRIRTDAGTEVDVWTVHLDYTPYGPYEAAFDGLPTAELIAHEEVRLAQLRDCLRRIDDTAPGAPGASGATAVPVVLVGDFNSPSHLDRPHLDRPDVDWPVTRAAEASGLRDSYREAHPDPVREPGHTWSPVHVEHEDGSGRPEPQDRIDFVLHRGLAVLDSRTHVSGTPRPWPDVEDNDWPSDHAAVITTFALEPGARE